MLAEEEPAEDSVEAAAGLATHVLVVASSSSVLAQAQLGAVLPETTQEAQPL